MNLIKTEPIHDQGPRTRKAVVMPRPEIVQMALDTVERSGVCEELGIEPSRPGPRPLLRSREILAGYLILVLMGLDLLFVNLKGLLDQPEVRKAMGLNSAPSYGQVRHSWSVMIDRIDERSRKLQSPELIDRSVWMNNFLLQAANYPELKLPNSYAVDATHKISFAAYRPKLKVVDGEEVWEGATSLDPASAAGHTPALNGQKGRVEVGTKADIIVHVKDVDGPKVPLFVAGVAVSPLNTSGVGQALPLVEHLVKSGREIDELIADRGYSNAKPETWAAHLKRWNIKVTHEAMPDQRAQISYKGAAVRDGDYFCPCTPSALLNDLGLNTSAVPIEQRVELSKRYDARAEYMLRSQGAGRYRCPAQAGHVRCEKVPASMRQQMDRPTVDWDGDETRACCNQASITVDPDYTLKAQQRFPYGTTKWLESYNRRALVEGLNGNLKANVTGLRRNSYRTLGATQAGVCHGLFLTALNLRSMQLYLYRHGLDDPYGNISSEDRRKAA